MTAMNAMPASAGLGLANPLDRTRLASLSWSKEEGERRRLAVITVFALVLFVPLALYIPTLNVPAPEREKTEALPPQLAKLIVEPKIVEKPDPKPVKSKAPPKPEPAQPVAKAVPKPVPVNSSPKPNSQAVEKARETASRSGLLTMKDRLASMRKPVPKAAPAIQANAGEVPSSVDTAKTQRRTQRGDEALQGSGGVKNAQVSTQAKAEVARHEVRQVAAPKQAQPAVASAPASTQKSAVGERPMSNIRQVFDSGKAALYSLYQRELRKDPTLAGKVLLELVIEPDGAVSACEVVSSELGNPPLEQKIALRVRLFNFGADNVEARKVRFPIDFLPG